MLNSLRIKWIATQIGVEKLILKQGKMVCYFVSDQQSDYYQSKRFHQVLQCHLRCKPQTANAIIQNPLKK
ncbi:hypothetical protein [Flavobacterium psychrophilum]|uniref:hypothetical protein n=1 Tax=Flavobacterium psychrophilum TaxID=96345 RepID=UPI0007C469DF|nr:hypothetical protein [Flavobacterium psychrophilum]OAE93928.1 hypothetical protein SU65_01020 [Flavobacterium psychrophilum]